MMLVLVVGMLCILTRCSAYSAPSERCPHTCTCWLGEVRCLSGGLTSIPYPPDHNNTEQMIISPAPSQDENNLNGLPRGSFVEYKWLKSLQVTRSNLTALAEGAFLGLNQLHLLNLSHNAITHINTEHWKGVEGLEVLDLQHNNLTLVISGVFYSLNNLKYLDLSHNNLTALAPRLFQDLGNLRTLILSNNPLHQVQPDIFQDLSQLVHLMLNNCSLDVLEKSMFTYMSKVRHLELNTNQLELIPRDAFQDNLPSLQDLYLEDNNLRKIIPGTLSNLTLRYVSLARNHLDMANMDAFVGTDIRGISLAHNNLEDGKLRIISPIAKHLRHLDLSGNTGLDLSHHDRLFKQLVRAEELVLRDFGFSSFNFHDISLLRTLVMIDISYNHLTDLIYVGTLSSMKTLHHLDISHNNFLRLPTATVDIISKLDNISLHDNQWACDCHIKPLRHFIQKSDQFYGACQVRWNKTCLHCHSPSELYYSEIWKVKDSEIKTCPDLSVASLQIQTKVGISVGVIAIFILLILIIIVAWKWRTVNYYTKEDKSKEYDNIKYEGDGEVMAHLEDNSLITSRDYEMQKSASPHHRNGGNHVTASPHQHYLPPQHTVNNVEVNDNNHPYHPHHFNHHYHQEEHDNATQSDKPRPPPKPARIVIEETDF